MTGVGSNRLPELAARIRRSHADVQAAATTAAQHAIETGRALIEAKGIIAHGEWLPWLREHCALAERTAQAYMKIAKSGLDAGTVAAMGLRAAEKAVTLTYPFLDPFYEGEESPRRDWWLFCLFQVRFLGYRVQDSWNHIYWISRKDFKTPAEWLGPEGQKWVRTWGGRIDENLLPQWQAFEQEREAHTAQQIEAELEKICESEPPRPLSRRRQGKSAPRADLGGAP